MAKKKKGGMECICCAKCGAKRMHVCGSQLDIAEGAESTRTRVLVHLGCYKCDELTVVCIHTFSDTVFLSLDFDGIATCKDA